MTLNQKAMVVLERLTHAKWSDDPDEFEVGIEVARAGRPEGEVVWKVTVTEIADGHEVAGGVGTTIEMAFSDLNEDLKARLEWYGYDCDGMPEDE